MINQHLTTTTSWNEYANVCEQVLWNCTSLNLCVKITVYKVIKQVVTWTIFEQLDPIQRGYGNLITITLTSITYGWEPDQGSRQRVNNLIWHQAIRCEHYQRYPTPFTPHLKIVPAILLHHYLNIVGLSPLAIGGPSLRQSLKSAR